MMNVFTARHVGLKTVLLAFGLIAAAPNTTFAQLFKRWCEPCVPCPTAPLTGTATPPGTGGPGTPAQPGTVTQPGDQAGQAPSAPATPSADLFAQSGTGFASGPESLAPGMVGDYFGGFVLFQGGSGNTATRIPLPGGAVPRFKMAENTSPLPTDRVFFNYDYYSNVPINNPPIGVNGFTAGFEKTLFGGVVSFEIRLPMATTLDNNIYLDGTTSTGVGEIGNLGMAVKALLLQSETYAVSAGLAISAPTAKDIAVFADQESSASTQILNQSVHLLPFVGGLWTPNERFFAIGYMQLDIDANGDSVNQTSFDDSGNLVTTNVGRYNEQTMLYLEGAVGYWIRREPPTRRFLNGIALFGELHMNQSLNTAQLGSLLVSENISILDMTAGVDLQFGRLTTVTAAFCTPLSEQREFDGQFRVLLNRRF
jgi:hypothetical protein